MQHNSDNILSQIKQQTRRNTTVYEKIIALIWIIFCMLAAFFLMALLCLEVTIAGMKGYAVWIYLVTLLIFPPLGAVCGYHAFYDALYWQSAMGKWVKIQFHILLFLPCIFYIRYINIRYCFEVAIPSGN